MTERPNLSAALAAHYRGGGNTRMEGVDLLKDTRELAEQCNANPGLIDQLRPEQQSAVRSFNLYQREENQQ